MNVSTHWQVGSQSRVIVQPKDEWDPPRLFMADASSSVTLVPPADREQHPEFVQFLKELTEAARELGAMCQ
ncbi:hypothetical protein [Kibdelosporangium aridum]|uniref:Uncharacterized protein n=1 Tax=Kibdelosporangium aridum TaxID=2030 RepID=A0A1W2FZE6_KIBAR|nr:hypothetical protein [Kibdelosporangium aridum]SMD27233.1 hypothetical protein SAMN05661093_10834 [Kibdelosporangium aridum]